MKFLFVLLLLLFGGFAQAAELNVIAPPVIKESMTELTLLFERSHPDTKVNLNFIPPDEVAAHLEKDTSVDVVLIFDKKHLDAVLQKKLIAEQEVIPLFRNVLVIVTEESDELTLEAIKAMPEAERKKVALFDENSFYGKQARAYLQKEKLLSADASEAVKSKNAKAIHSAIKEDRAKWGVMFSSDAARLKNIKTIGEIPEKDIAPVFTYAALTESTDQREDAKLYVSGLQTTIARKIFENAGFRLGPLNPSQYAPDSKTQTKPAKTETAQTQTSQTQTTKSTDKTRDKKDPSSAKKTNSKTKEPRKKKTKEPTPKPKSS